MTENRTKVIVLSAVSLGLTAGIFALDLLTPLGIPVWLFYLAPILLWALTPSRIGPFALAGLCSALTLHGISFSLAGAPVPFGLINRSFGVLLFWIAAFAVAAPRAEGSTSRRSRETLSRTIVASIAGAALLLVLQGAASYQAIRLFHESEQIVAHAHELLTELSAVLVTLTDAETGQRSFLLTGQEPYLEPYNRGLRQLDQHIRRVKTLTQDNPVQRSRVPALEAKIAEKLAELGVAVMTRRNEGLGAAIRIVLSDRGTSSMDEIRALIAEMEDTEQGLLNERTRLSAIMFRSLLSHLSLGGLLQIGSLAVAGLLVRRAQIADRIHVNVETDLRGALATLDATVDGVFIFDPQTLRFNYVNEGAVRQVGYSREELLRMTPLDIKPEFDEPRFRAMIAPLLSGAESAHSSTTIHRRKDGVDVPVQLNLQCVRGGTSQSRLIAVVRDITEQQRTEDKFRRVVEGAPNAMILVNQKGIIGLVNVQVERLFGYSREELLGQSIETLVPARFRDAHPGYRAQFFADPKPRAMGPGRDLYGLHKDGSEIPIEVDLNPVETAEGLMVLSSITDNTERKRTEEETRRQRQLLEAANQELEAFSYAVSHDLRAPLRSIDGFSQALLEDCADRLNEQGTDHLNRIRAASQRMGQLIDDLLSLSRATRDDLRRETVDLSALVLSTADELRESWPGRHVELVVAPGLCAEGDPRLLRIVFDNLLGNAWKFTSKQERATIEVGAMSQEGTKAYFVRDNGVGFDMAYVDKLFGAFQRLHTMAEYSGTGIGLATVKRIVVRHGGSVWTEGRVGQGATFYFTLGERSA